MLRVSIWAESFRCADILLLQWERENFAHRQHLKFCHFQPVQLRQHKSYIAKGIQPIFEIFTSARKSWEWAFGWKFSGAPVFYFCNGMVKTSRVDNIWNFATFNLYTVPVKILYIQRFSTDFRNPGLSSKMLREGVWVKVSGAPVFYFCNGKVKTLRMEKIWDFATFNLYTVPGKILYLQSCSTDFRNLCLSSKTFEGGHLVGKFQGTQVFYFCKGKVKTLRIHNIWNFATFNLYTVPGKILYRQKVFNRF